MCRRPCIVRAAIVNIMLFFVFVLFESFHIQWNNNIIINSNVDHAVCRKREKERRCPTAFQCEFGRNFTLVIVCGERVFGRKSDVHPMPVSMLKRLCEMRLTHGMSNAVKRGDNFAFVDFTRKILISGIRNFCMDVAKIALNFSVQLVTLLFAFHDIYS